MAANTTTHRTARTLHAAIRRGARRCHDPLVKRWLTGLVRGDAAEKRK